MDTCEKDYNTIGALKPVVARNSEDIKEITKLLQKFDDKMDVFVKSIHSIENTVVALSTKLKIYVAIAGVIFMLITPSITAVVSVVVLSIFKLAFSM